MRVSVNGYLAGAKECMSVRLNVSESAISKLGNENVND